MATIKYWNGSAWELAIVGKQGPAGATGPTGPAGQASLQRFRYVATGGQTSVSGTDANGNTLAYTPGLEEVFINGAAQVRGQDYTATNGTSITGISALIVGDVVEIYAWGVFNVANTIPNTLIDAKGDILAGTGADSVGRLAVGGNGTVLTADSAEATGLKWAAPAAATQSWTLLNSGNTATTSGTAITWTGLSGYNHIKILFDNITITGGAGNTLRLRFNGDETFKYERFGNNFRWTTTYDRQQFNGFGGVDDCYRIAVYEDNTASALSGGLTISGANSTATKMVNYTAGATAFNGGTNMNMRITEGRYVNTSVINSITITPDGGRSFTAGNAYIYGAQ